MELVIGDTDVEKIGVCPYDSNHRIKMKKIEAHMEKCRDRNRPRTYVTCPFNATHVKFKEEIQLHMELCPDKLAFGKVTDIDSFVARKSCIEREIESRDVLGNEDWDAVEVPLTYDPEMKLRDVRFQPKNFHKRKEETYHPRACTVIASNEDGESGIYLPNESYDGTIYNCHQPSSGYSSSARNVYEWDQYEEGEVEEEEEEDSFDAEFAEEQKLASMKNVNSWLENMHSPNANSGFGEACDIPPGFSSKRLFSPLTDVDCFESITHQLQEFKEEDSPPYASHQNASAPQRLSPYPDMNQRGFDQDDPYSGELDAFEEDFARENGARRHYRF